MAKNDVQIFYQCHICDEIFQQFCDLEIHKKFHVKQEFENPRYPQQEEKAAYPRREIFMCRLCDVKFFTYIDLEEHCKVHVNSDVNNVEMSDNKSINQYAFFIPKSFENQEESFECKLCVAKFLKYVDLEVHCKIHIKNEVDAVVASDGMETDSVRTGKEPDINSEQDKGNVGTKSVTKDINSHNHDLQNVIEKPFKCYVCSKSFRKSSHLKQHCEEKYKFDVCNKTFTRRLALHKYRVSHYSEKPYKCCYCGESFALHSSCKQHEKIHSKEKFKCDVCGKTYSYRAYLRRHMIIHTEVNPYKNGVCSKNVSPSASLKQHGDVHCDQKLYKCDVCDKTFTYSSDLHKHLNTHSEEKTNKCDVCDKTFTYSSDMRKHLNMHGGENSYKCDICSRIFRQSSNLKPGVKIDLASNKRCDICSEVLRIRKDLVKPKI